MDNLHLYLEYNCLESIDFIMKIPHEHVNNKKIHESSALILGKLYQNQHRHAEVITLLKCKKFQMDEIICSCCPDPQIFIRGISYHALNPNYKITVENNKNTNNPFLIYLQCLFGSCTMNIAENSINALEILPDFYEAALLLGKTTRCAIKTSNLYLTNHINMLLFVQFNYNTMLDTTLIVDQSLYAAYLFLNDDLDASIKLYNELIYKKSNYDYIEYYILIILSTNDNSIIAKLNSILNLVPNTILITAVLLFLNNKIKEAIKLMKKLIKNTLIHSQIIIYNLILINVLIKKIDSEYDDVVSDISSSISNILNLILNNELLSRYAFTLGSVCYKIKEYDKALYLLSHVTKNDLKDSLKLRGRIYYKYNMYDAAKEHFVLASSHGSDDALLYLAELYKKMNNSKAAIESYKKYLSVSTQGNNRELVEEYLKQYYEEQKKLNKNY